MSYKTVLKENAQIHYVSSSDMIKFIDQNSDMKWNDVCNFVREKNIVGEEGRAMWTPIGMEQAKYYNEHQVKWVNAFFVAHPWIKRMMIVFDD